MVKNLVQSGVDTHANSLLLPDCLKYRMYSYTAQSDNYRAIYAAVY
jgi:hypothetical protein